VDGDLFNRRYSWQFITRKRGAPDRFRDAEDIVVNPTSRYKKFNNNRMARTAADKSIYALVNYAAPYAALHVAVLLCQMTRSQFANRKFMGQI
jgi:hypothetical protein